MKVLFCYRYGILGGVCTQLINRLRMVEPGTLDAHLLFSEDHGISRTLEGEFSLIFEKDPVRVRRIAERDDFDAAVVIDTPEILSVLSKIPHLPVVTEVHTTYDQGLGYLEEPGWSTVGFIVPSLYSKTLVEERFPGAVDRPIHMVPNGVDPTLFPIVELDQIPPRPVWGWVGKLDAHKNWRGFLSTASLVLERGGDADFWMIGGDTAPASAEDELLSEITERNLDSRVRWLPRIEYRAMHRVYAALRQSGGGMLVTSRDESFGMSVLEALICRCPVVAGRVGGIPEIASESLAFHLYGFGDYGQAADAVLGLLDPEAHARATEHLAEEAPGLAERYSNKRVATDYAATLAALVKSGRSGSTTSSTTLNTDWNGSVAELQSEIEKLRPYVPGGEVLDPVNLLRSTVRLLDGRSYRLARTVAARTKGPKFWLTLPLQAWRILRATGPRSTKP